MLLFILLFAFISILVPVVLAGFAARADAGCPEAGDFAGLPKPPPYEWRRNCGEVCAELMLIPCMNESAKDPPKEPPKELDPSVVAGTLCSLTRLPGIPCTVPVVNGLL